MSEPAVVPEAFPGPELIDDDLEGDAEVHERVTGALPHMVFAFAFGCVAVAGFALCAAIWAVATLPTLRDAQSRGHERKATRALRAIAQAQRRFHDEDLDKNGKHDYGTLAQLGMAGLLDPDLASGFKDGYQVETGPSQVAPEEEWMAVANPFTVHRGERCFVTNHDGPIYFQQWGQPLVLDLQRCAIPDGTQRVHRGDDPLD